MCVGDLVAAETKETVAVQSFPVEDTERIYYVSLLLSRLDRHQLLTFIRGDQIDALCDNDMEGYDVVETPEQDTLDPVVEWNTKEEINDTRSSHCSDIKTESIGNTEG